MKRKSVTTNIGAGSIQVHVKDDGALISVRNSYRTKSGRLVERVVWFKLNDWQVPYLVEGLGKVVTARERTVAHLRTLFQNAAGTP